MMLLASRKKATAFYSVFFYNDMTEQITNLKPVFDDLKLALLFCDVANSKHAERVYFINKVDKEGERV